MSTPNPDRVFCLPSKQDNEQIELLAKNLGVQRIVAQILYSRGYLTEQSALSFLYPRLNDLRKPEGELPMAGFSRAVDRIAKAILSKEKIGIFADYDVDGITTCALLTDFLLRLGVTVYPKLATRTSGYGFSVEAAHDLLEKGCRLIITGDCGTSDIEALSYCKNHNVDTIVVDHHQVPTVIPPTLSLLNPHQQGCLFPFKGMASVGIAFYLISALRTRLKNKVSITLPNMTDFLDLVALGTIADLAPLEQENRILVRAGLIELRQTKRPGLKALVKLSGLDEISELSSSDVAFRIAPRLNAPGRLHDPTLALNLLLERNEVSANQLATLCHAANTDRQTIQDAVVQEATKLAQEQIDTHNPPVLVLANHHWHHGVLGIVAAKITEIYKKPSAILSILDNKATGSMRTIKGFNCYLALKKAAPFLLRFGGHAAAAGLSTTVESIDTVRQLLCQAYMEQSEQIQSTTSVLVDAVAQPHEINLELLKNLSLLEPFGMGNAEPLLCLHQATLIRQKTVGKGHIQAQFVIDDHSFESIGFSLGPQFQAINPSKPLSIVFTPDLDTFRGYPKVKLRVKYLKQELSLT